MKRRTHLLLGWALLAPPLLIMAASFTFVIWKLYHCDILTFIWLANIAVFVGMVAVGMYLLVHTPENDMPTDGHDTRGKK